MEEKDLRNLEVGEKEEGGDDELTAIDLSAAFLLERADWTRFYNQKGYSGSFPFLLYMHEDADILNDRLLAEVNRTQMLKGRNKLQIDLFTRFTENQDGEVVGMAWLEISGLRALAPDLVDDLVSLFQSGATVFLTQSYQTHGKEVEIKWYETYAEVPYAPLFQDKKPPKANLDLAERCKFASLKSL